jgi:hypothetical protein
MYNSHVFVNCPSFDSSSNHLKDNGESVMELDFDSMVKIRIEFSFSIVEKMENKWFYAFTTGYLVKYLQ